jgi:hypothetical protein
MPRESDQRRSVSAASSSAGARRAGDAERRSEARRDARNAVNTAVGESKRAESKTHFIKQIRVCGNHNQFDTAVFKMVRRGGLEPPRDCSR